jgi:putative DNA primase/helicase
MSAMLRYNGPAMPVVAALLAERIAELAPELVGDKTTTRGRTEWRFRGKGSLSVVIAGPKRGSWYDHEAGCGGDALDLIAHLRRCTMREAYHWALAWLGTEARQELREVAKRPELSQRQPETDPAKAELAARLWREAVPAVGSPVARYLAGRGLELPPAGLFSADPADHRNACPLRFHPACPRGAERLPAMVALMTDPTSGEPCGVHRTFLLPDGTGKAPGEAKMMLGGAGAVRLTPDAEVAQALGIAEGIETSLAIMQRGWSPVWATGSAPGIKRFPVLPGIECLTVFPDADDGGASLRAAQQCAERWHAAGVAVRFGTPPAGTDFADLAGRAA